MRGGSTRRETPRRAVRLGNLSPVADSSENEARLSAVEARVEEVAAEAAAARQDAAAARHLASAQDRDVADLGIKIDANRKAINALGVQTAARFDVLEHRFDRLEGEMRTGFAEMRGKLDQAAAGRQHIVTLLNRLLPDH